MKTLREHWLDRSRETATESELAAMRARVIRGLDADPAGDDHAGETAWALAWPRVLWRELVWPCRGTWACIAAAWLAVAALGLDGLGNGAGEAGLGPRELALMATMTRERELWRELEARLARGRGTDRAGDAAVDEAPASRGAFSPPLSVMPSAEIAMSAPPAKRHRDGA